MKKILENNKVILMEAAIIERLRRSHNVTLHQILVNAPLIYNDDGREELGKIYQEYIDISLGVKTPFLMCTPTWRANQTRVRESNVNPSINVDAVHFLQEIRSAQQSDHQLIKIGGQIGCKNDCYKPKEGLSATDAEQPPNLFKRLIGYQANASSLDHCDLDGADELKSDHISDWGNEMLNLNKSYGVKILGGCCGTGSEH